MADDARVPEATVGYPGQFAGEGVPKRLSSNAMSLCWAEWSWSPGHSRDDGYALHSGRNDWFLWLSFYNDCDLKIDRNVIGKMPKAGVNAEIAARVLLTAFWRFDQKETDLARPHRCRSGWLSDQALTEIMEDVWGQG